MSVTGFFKNAQERDNFIIYLTHECIRNNTPLEDYHCAGKIDDEEMKALMKAICNNLVGFLCFFLTHPDYLPVDIIKGFKWDKPKNNFCPNFLHFYAQLQNEIKKEQEKA